jgi:acyl dehydratase
MSNSPPDRLYLDDLFVGQRFTSATHTIDEAQIKVFAAQFDPQPFHTDETTAKDTFFRGLAASGWHTAAITMRLNVDTGLPLAGGIIGAGGEISWPARRGLALPCTWKARWSRSRRPDQSGIAV